MSTGILCLIALTFPGTQAKMSDKMGLGIAETLLVLGEDDTDYATMLFSVKVTPSFVTGSERAGR